VIKQETVKRAATPLEQATFIEFLAACGVTARACTDLAQYEDGGLPFKAARLVPRPEGSRCLHVAIDFGQSTWIGDATGLVACFEAACARGGLEDAEARRGNLLGVFAMFVLGKLAEAEDERAFLASQAQGKEDQIRTLQRRLVAVGAGA
jgi:hypothetical protein